MNSKASSVVVYLSALLTGLTMVSFAASSSYLKEKGLSDGEYGFIFIPQLITAIIGSILGGSISRRAGLKNLMLIMLLLIGLSQLSFLVAVNYLTSGTLFYGTILSTSLFGLGFGFSAAPLNTYPGLLFPKTKESALVALHTILGGGLALGPLIVGTLINNNFWVGYPGLIITIAVFLMIASKANNLPEMNKPSVGASENTEVSVAKHPVMILFAIVTIMYSFAEGTFANWAVVFLNEQKGIPLVSASGALSIFWASLAGGRLITSILLLRIPSKSIWLALPIFIGIVFLIMPLVNSAFTGILFFALAGLACSAFFPITMDLATKYFKSNAALASSIMTAALMFGVGVGSFLIGALRSLIDLDTLFRISALYPVVVLILAVFMSAKYLKKQSS